MNAGDVRAEALVLMAPAVEQPSFAPTVELILLAVGGLLTLVVVAIFAMILWKRHDDPAMDAPDDPAGREPQ